MDFTASLKNFGNRIASVFERKKKDASQIAEEKEKKVEDVVEQQLTKAADILKETKRDSENVAKSTGTIQQLNCDNLEMLYYFYS